MNWRRGLLRAWVALSIGWIALIVLIAEPFEKWTAPTLFYYKDWRIEIPGHPSRDEAVRVVTGFIQSREPLTRFSDLLPPPVAEAEKVVGRYRGDEHIQRLIPVTALALGLPAFMLVLGLATWWVLRGFRR